MKTKKKTKKLQGADITIDPEQFKKICEEDEEKALKNLRAMAKTTSIPKPEGGPGNFLDDVEKSIMTSHKKFMENTPGYGKYFSTEYQEELKNFTLTED